MVGMSSVPMRMRNLSIRRISFMVRERRFFFLFLKANECIVFYQREKTRTIFTAMTSEWPLGAVMIVSVCRSERTFGKDILRQLRRLRILH